MIHLDEVTYDNIPLGINFVQSDQEIFTSEPASVRFLPYQGDQANFQTAVTFELWSTKKTYTRVDYGFLDWLADIGGLYSVLHVFTLVLISNFISNGPSLFVATDLIAKPDSQPPIAKQDS